jgi:drug/metabolite transporter (DMT)-like permease
MKSGASLTAISAICLGIGLVAEKAALSHTSLGAYFIFGFAAQTIALIIIAFKDFKLLKIKQISKYDLQGAVLIGVFSALTGFFYIYSLKHADNIGLVSMASTFQLPLSVLAGYLILKERDNVARLTFACLIAFSGLLINTLS